MGGGRAMVVVPPEPGSHQGRRLHFSYEDIKVGGLGKGECAHGKTPPLDSKAIPLPRSPGLYESLLITHLRFVHCSPAGTTMGGKSKTLQNSHPKKFAKGGRTCRVCGESPHPAWMLMVVVLPVVFAIPQVLGLGKGWRGGGNGWWWRGG
jgi:hypothetical protein